MRRDEQATHLDSVRLGLWSLYRDQLDSGPVTTVAMLGPPSAEYCHWSAGAGKIIRPAVYASWAAHLAMSGLVLPQLFLPIL